jgi:hypothetical protein
MADRLTEDVFLSLRDEFLQAGYESVIHRVEGKPVLKVLADMLGERKGAAILELLFQELEVKDSRRLLQFYVTFDFQVNMEKSYEIYNALNQINTLSAIGAFCLIPGEKQLCYKYSSVLPGKDVDGLKSDILPVVNWMLPMLEQTYDSLHSLVTGTF